TSVNLEHFVELVFSGFGLDWRSHVETRAELFRPTDLIASYANPAKASEVLGWQAQYAIQDVVKFMIEERID
ncbi:MAG: GDP-mannose 4,6-dehydratase, partial [Gallionella sp.]